MDERNWTGSKASAFTMIGTRNYAKEARQVRDYYATPPKMGKLLLELEDFNNILEPACGAGHLSKVFKEKGKKVISTDIVDRGYGSVKDFFAYTYWNGDIITNPPYKYAKEFVYHSLSIIPEGRKIAMFLKLQFLESKNRKELFLKYPPKKLYVSSSRMGCAMNGDFNNQNDSAVAYGWFIWVKGFQGDPIIKWFN